MLQREGRRHAFLAAEVCLEELPDPEGGGAISSTAVRARLALGDLAGVQRLLGRPLSVLGEVVPGDRRGRTIGFPTCNLDLEGCARPPRGVYAVWARTIDALGRPGPCWPGVANLGRRPTVCPEQSQDLLEVHLLEGGRDLYGELLEVAFLARLREEQRFADLPALKAQIARDAAGARALLVAGQGPQAFQPAS